MFVVFLFGCSSSNVKLEKGHSTYIEGDLSITKELDNRLNYKAKISGYVYSNIEKHFLKNAMITIGNKKYYTNSNGYFSVKAKPGIYVVKASYKDHTGITITDIQAEENHHVFLNFKLGLQQIID